MLPVKLSYNSSFIMTGRLTALVYPSLKRYSTVGRALLPAHQHTPALNLN